MPETTPPSWAREIAMGQSRANGRPGTIVIPDSGIAKPEDAGERSAYEYPDISAERGDCASQPAAKPNGAEK
jgi:hypothetical protein